MAATSSAPAYKTVDEYISSFSPDTQKILKEVRKAIRKAAPGAEEVIKYAIPTYVRDGNIISFGAWKTHIGIYPAPRESADFKKELSAYKGNKSTLQFPLSLPVPADLIGRIVQYNIRKMKAKAQQKKK